MIWIWTQEFIKGIFTIGQIAQNMASKYVMTSNVRYNEKRHYDVTFIAREGLSSMIALFKVDLTVQNDKYLFCDENCTGPDSMHCGPAEICKHALMLLDCTRTEQSIGMRCTLLKNSVCR